MHAVKLLTATSSARECMYVSEGFCTRWAIQRVAEYVRRGSCGSTCGRDVADSRVIDSTSRTCLYSPTLPISASVASGRGSSSCLSTRSDRPIPLPHPAECRHRMRREGQKKSCPMAYLIISHTRLCLPTIANP